MDIKNHHSAKPSFQSILDDLIAGPFAELANGFKTYPAANIQELKDKYTISLTIPGLEREQIDIISEKEKLTVSASQDVKEEMHAYSRLEFDYRNFSRSFHLPETVDHEKIGAEYKDGILNIHLPKQEAAKEKDPVRITIQ